MLIRRVHESRSCSSFGKHVYAQNTAVVPGTLQQHRHNVYLGRHYMQHLHFRHTRIKLQYSCMLYR